MDDLDEEALDTMVNAGVSWSDHEASSWRHILARNPDDADAERNIAHFRELRRRIPALAEAIRHAEIMA